MNELACLKIENIVKSFYGNTVLFNVTHEFKSGVVTALIGENGAGKTTLMNIISGAMSADSGSIFVNGKKVKLRNPLQARDLGITFVHQELSLFPYLSVAENIMMGKEPRKSKIILDHQKCLEDAQEILDEIDFNIDVNKLIMELSPAEKQMVEIAKAYSACPKLIIFDEPTTSLNKAETEKLFEFVDNLVKKNIAVIFISHRLDEIFKVADEVVILKDGQITLKKPIGDVDKDQIITAMIGREQKQTFPPRADNIEQNPIILELKSVGLESTLDNIDLTIRAGCVVGIGGLEGQGQRTLARALFGIELFDRGKLYFEGEEVKISNPSVAINNKIAYIPDDRKDEGLVLPLGIKQNLTMLVQKLFSKLGVINKKKQEALTHDSVKILDIKHSDINAPVKNLSGGNQQKVVFTKWLLSNPKLIILNEPTRGIDINSKIVIYETIRELTQKGVGVILFSKDMLELIGLSDIIYVMYDGRIVGNIPGNEATEECIMKLSAGMDLHEERVENV